MQKIWKFSQVALANIFENKTKSLLTMLGIIIGIAAVILVVSVGKSAEQLILSSVQSFGPRSVFIQPGGGDRGGPPSITAIDKIKYKDYLAIKNLNYVEDVSAFLLHQAVVSYQDHNQNTRIIGTDENYPKVMNVDVVEGRFIDQSDLVNETRVVVIGYKTADELFGDQPAVGRQIKIGANSFQVIGVMGKQGTRFFQDFDSRVMIPLTTMKTRIKGVDYVSTIFLNAKGNVNETVDDLRVFLRNRHQIPNINNDTSKDDFRVLSQVDAANTFEGISNVLSLFLIFIAGISLLVGGIGIMNIMLVSVSDRTREIGLRKAVGATNSDVQTQFLIEAVVLTLVAGVLGILLGVSLAWIAALIMKNFQDQWQFIVTFDSIALSFTVSAFIGMVFGLYPAFIAARLNPIEALIEES